MTVDAGSKEAFATLGSTDMQKALVLMSEISYQARQVGLENISVPLRKLLAQLGSDLQALARSTATVADKAAVARLRETRVRPETTKGLHLEDLILSLPFPNGSVKVAIIDELNKATNVNSGYGPYWRAQEYGSVAVGNVMTGRVLFGRFEGPAHDEVPRAEFAGGHAPGAEFRYTVPGEEGGLGTITHEDQPRHFLEAGLGAAETSYQAGITRLSRGYGERILGLGA